MPAPDLSRRGLLAASALAALLPRAGRAADTTVRIGVQKYGTLLILRERGTLEKALHEIGWTVAWSEFPSGPALLEAMTAGALDFGTAGETPPVFAQAAGSTLVYVGCEPPAPAGEAILVPSTSPLKTLAELKGRTVAFNKGSNVHYLVVEALRSAGLRPSDIQPAYLAPADARAAFERGSIDAWAIWDPFLSAAQATTGARVLADGQGLVPNRQYLLAGRSFATAQPAVLRRITAALDASDRQAAADKPEATRLLSAAMGLPPDVVARCVDRMGYGVLPMSPAVVAEQQAIADAFHDLHLIPQAPDVSRAVWSSAA